MNENALDAIPAGHTAGVDIEQVLPGSSGRVLPVQRRWAVRQPWH